MLSARKPTARLSPSATTPRTIGRRSVQWRACSGSIERATWAISPSGLRTATAQWRGPRIITPSRTAWPPMAWDTALRGRARCALGLLEAALEALDASTGVQQLLLAGVERVARRTDLDMELGLRGTRRERVPAPAVHRGENVVGVDLRLHRRARIAAAVCVATFPPETSRTGRSASIRPLSQAAVATAAAGSQASFARS